MTPLLRRTAAVAVALAALLASAATQAAPKVVVTIVPVHALVAAVMDGVAEPHLLIPGGQSPHTYALKPSEARALAGADLVVWIGPGLEAFLEHAMEGLVDPVRSLSLLRVDGVIRLRTRTGGTWEAHAHADGREDGEAKGHQGAVGHAGEDSPGGIPEHEIDPHAWLDPANAGAMTDAIASRLAALDPENAAAYAANARRARAAIDAAAADARRLLAPVADVPFIVFHDAYQYFERAFGLAGVGSVTLGPDRRPSARRLYDIRRKILDVGARCVFREPQFAPDLVATVIEGTGARSGALDPLGTGLEPGPDAYPRLLAGLARAAAACLGPGE